MQLEHDLNHTDTTKAPRLTTKPRPDRAGQARRKSLRVTSYSVLQVGTEGGRLLVKPRAVSPVSLHHHHHWIAVQALIQGQGHWGLKLASFESGRAQVMMKKRRIKMMATRGNRAYLVCPRRREGSKRKLDGLGNGKAQVRIKIR